MSSKITVTRNTLNFKDVEAQLNKNGEAAVKAAIAVAKGYIHVGTPVKEGLLDSSIQDIGNKYNINEIKRNGPSIVGTFGTSIGHALRVEYGFEGQDKLGREYHQAGKYFFQDGFGDAIEDMIKIIRQILFKF